jgi:hypothetical protein
MPNVRRAKSGDDGTTAKVDTVSRDAVKTANARRRREQRHTGSVLDLNSIDADALKRAVQVLLERKVGITFGVTRDGGALSITILDNGENVREYVRANEDVNLYFAGLADDFRED